MQFSGCSPADLDALAAALTSGRLVLPLSSVAIERLGIAGPSNVVGELEALSRVGFQEEQLGRLLQALAAERRAAAENQPSLDVVVTGPDARETSRDTSVVVNQLFGEATASVLVVGFALYKGKVVFRRLAERMDELPGLDVTLCLDISRRGTDTTKDDDLIARFANRFVTEEWPGARLPKVYFDPRGLTMIAAERAVLHAKCIVVDGRAALVTSANPTPAAYERNIELGLIVRGGDVPERVRQHFEGLISTGVLRPLILGNRR